MPGSAWMWKRCPSRARSRRDHEHRDGAVMENVAERVVVDALLDLVDDRRTRGARADLRAHVQAVADPRDDVGEAFPREPFELFLLLEVFAGLRHRAKATEVARRYGERHHREQRDAAADLASEPRRKVDRLGREHRLVQW